MSLIEKAVQRLDQLKKAEGSPPESSQAPRVSESAASGGGPSSGAGRGAVRPAGVSPGASAPTASAQSGARASRTLEIDLALLATQGMVTPDRPKSVLAEQYRVIKRPLIRNFKGGGAAKVAKGNLIMVTSSLPGEGKSFSSINLAVSLAMEMDFTVLLVDADFSKPSILPRLGIGA